MKPKSRSAHHLSRLAAVVLMALALVMPSIAPAFAASLLSPEQALARDIALSLCRESNGSSPAKSGHDGKNCDLCVLCRTLASASIPSASDLQAAVAPASRSAIASIAEWHVPSDHPLDSATGPPRAPPSAA